VAIPLWQPGFLYQPGDLVRPTNAGAVAQQSLENPDFELGAFGWTFGGISGGGAIEQLAPAFDGTWRVRIQDLSPGSEQYTTLENNARIAVTPGQIVNAKCYVRSFDSADECRALIKIRWFDSIGGLISESYMAVDPTIVGGHHQRVTVSNPPVGARGGLIGLACLDWTQIAVQGVAPVNAATFSVMFQGNWLQEGGFYVDGFTLEFVNTEPPNTNVYRAVQAASGFSGSSEPDWPLVLGTTVIDNDVTWEAVAGNTVTWEAHRILVSGAVQPVWPTVAGAAVPDNTIAWVLDSRRVNDAGTPQSPMAVIGASKIFSPDGDIIDFSATVNPLDWSTKDDAGYLPFGLQNYGANPIAAMGLYRGHLVAFNSQGCQIWQIDEDPAAMSLLDALPISCTFPKSVQPVGDDLAFLSSLGIRSLGLVGASINLQGGYFGKQVDSLVIPEIANAVANGWTPRGIYWPAQGQYWLFFGPQAFVLTINGPRAEQRSWSRYTFPAVIDDWTLMGDELHLRSGNLVWRVDRDAKLDDKGGANVPFVSVLQWPHLDLGSFNVDKELVGFDLAIDGECVATVGYDQTFLNYDATTAWTDPYPVDEDTVPGQIIPFSATGPSFSLRLEFPSEQSWKWYSSNLYIKDLQG
jgi:hypothetical protein